MFRQLLLLAATLVPFAGCRVCDGPYDYDGPVVPCGESYGGGCSTCGHGDGEVIYSGSVPSTMPSKPSLPRAIPTPAESLPMPRTDRPAGPMTRRPTPAPTAFRASNKSQTMSRSQSSQTNSPFLQRMARTPYSVQQAAW